MKENSKSLKRSEPGSMVGLEEEGDEDWRSLSCYNDQQSIPFDRKR
jgi:hypothetical protein